MTELKKYLITLSGDDMERALEYYNEIYEDKNEAGIPEKEIIYQFGNPRDAAKKILDDLASANEHAADNSRTYITPVIPEPPQQQPPPQPLPQMTMANEPVKSKTPVWAIVLLIICIPFLIGPVIGVVSTVFALFITAWTLVGVLFIVAGALILSGLAGIIYSVYTLTMSGPIGLAQLGISLAALGIGILMLIAAVIVLRLWIKANIVLFKLLIRLITFGKVKFKIFNGSKQGGQQ